MQIDLIDSHHCTQSNKASCERDDAGRRPKRSFPDEAIRNKPTPIAVSRFLLSDRITDLSPVILVSLYCSKYNLDPRPSFLREERERERVWDRGNSREIIIIY